MKNLIFPIYFQNVLIENTIMNINIFIFVQLSGYSDPLCNDIKTVVYEHDLRFTPEIVSY